MPKGHGRNSALVESSEEIIDTSGERSAGIINSDVAGDSTRIQEAKKVIIALKDKLMERHLMSKKIAELEKILQKINGATNKIMIEMDNRVDDLDRDWQRRLQGQNIKWKNRAGILNNYDNSSKLKETGSAYDASDPMWRTERRLIEIVDRLAPIGKMERNLEDIIKMLKNNNNQPCPTSPVATGGSQSSANDVTRHTSSVQSDDGPQLYGVVEMTEYYSTCLRNLERAIKSLESIKQVPTIFGISPGGISITRDIDFAINVLENFNKKLKISLHNCNFAGSRETKFG